MSGDDLEVVNSIGDLVKNALFSIPHAVGDFAWRTLAIAGRIKWRDLANVRKHRKSYMKLVLLFTILYTIRLGLQLGGMWSYLTAFAVWWVAISYTLHYFFLFRVIGLTGGISTGKTMCSRELKSAQKSDEGGATIIDFDTIAHELYLPGMPVWTALRREFGDQILWRDAGDKSHVSQDARMQRQVSRNNTDKNNSPAWTINRKKLGEIVFNDPGKRRKLNGIITWPFVRALAWETIKSVCYHQSRRVVWDAPLLYERWPMRHLCDHVVCVTCTTEQQLRRLCQRDGITEKEAKARIGAQMSIAEKEKMTAGVGGTLVRNTSTKESAFRQLNEWWWSEEKIQQSKPTRLSLLFGAALTPAAYIFYRFLIWL